MTQSLWLEAMRKRAHAVRTRALVRRWKYRQRNLAAGVWFHVRRALADAQEAWEIPIETAEKLLAEGYKAEDWGSRLEPPKTVLFVDHARLSQLESRRGIPLRLGPDFLLAKAVALIPFTSVSGV